MTLAQTSRHLEEIHTRVERSPLFGFDTESSGPLLKFLKGKKKMINTYASTLTGFSVDFEDGGYYVPLRHRQGNAPIAAGLDLLRFILSGRHGNAVAMHHSKHERLVARLEGIPFASGLQVRDSELESWLAEQRSDDPEHPFALKLLAKKYANLEMGTFEQTVGKDHSFCDISPVAGERYAIDDALAARRLCLKFGPMVKDLGLWDHYQNVELPFVQVLRHMEDTGVYINPEVIERIQRDLTPKVSTVRDEFIWLVGADIASPKAGAVLYGDGHWSREGIEATKTGHKADKAAVAIHLARCPEGSLGRRAAELKAEFQMLNKILSTYTWKMVEVAQQYPDGRIHCNYHHTGTRTGRLSCSYINLQQIPIRTALGKSIREAFQAASGWSFVAADESQFEIRILAHLLGRGRFYDAFHRDPKSDAHMETAQAAGVTRQQAKVLLLAILYRARAYKLSKTLGLSVEDAQAVLDSLMAGMPEVPELQDRMIAAARRRGGIKTLLGRIRPTPDVLLNGNTKEIRKRRWAAERVICNTPVQGGARDYMTLAMVNLYKDLERQGELGRIKFSFQIHDELGLEAQDGVLDEAERMIQHHMQNAMPMRVPMIAEPTRGKTWMALK